MSLDVRFITFIKIGEANILLGKGGSCMVEKPRIILKKETTKKTIKAEIKKQETKIEAPEKIQESVINSGSVEETKDPFFLHKTILLVAIAALLFFNQMQIGTVTALLDISVPFSTGLGSSGLLTFSGGDVDLSDVDVTQIKSTAQGIAVLFSVGDIKTTEDAIAIMIPSGTPEYGEAMGGISYDDPVTALSKLEAAYNALKQQAKENDDIWQRYLGLAAAPRGISCEFCCGVGAQGVDASGNSKCGCAHNPAVQSVTLWLMLNTEYSDAEILREVYKWKSIWFPKNMVSLALDIAGGDTSVLQDLPGMVGGC